MPIQQYYALQYDRCEGYAAEREQLLAFLHGFVGQTDAGTAIDALFFKPAPPNGMGMQCAALDTYGYAQVTVTARRLRVAMKDANTCARPDTRAHCDPHGMHVEEAQSYGWRTATRAMLQGDSVPVG